MMNRILFTDELTKLRNYVSSRRLFWKNFIYDGEQELRIIPKFVKSGSVALDVGGCIGTYTYHLARFAKTVYVFEPNPELAARISRLGIKNAIVNNVALSSAQGTAELRVPKLTSGRIEKGMASLEKSVVGDDAIAYTVNVPLRTIDGYGFTNVSFMKIDVEGHEEAVIDGAIGTIKSSKPVLLVEIEERHNRGGLERIKSKLKGLGYDGFFLDKGKNVPIEQFSHEKDQKYDEIIDQTKGAAASLGRIRYINNFIFIPK